VLDFLSISSGLFIATFIIVFGPSTVFWISLLALFLSGIADGVSVVIR
jgi:hypothetical protein